MLQILFALGVAAGVLFVVEILWRKRFLEREAGRKIVHVLIGIWVACWPLFLDFSQIRLIAVIMFIGIVASRQMKLFRAIHNVERTTMGEIFFPVAIFIATLLTDTNWIFSVAMLELGMADGLASIVGGRSRRTTFVFFGQKKSVSGSLTFLLVSLAIIGTATQAHNTSIITGMYIAIMVTFTELVSPFGLDDLTVPLLTVWLLGNLV